MILNVVVADDDKNIATYLKKIIEEVADVRVVAIAGDGRETIKLVKTYKPQVVCLDIDMPEMNGVEVARELREIQPGINYVFVTVYPDYALEAFELYSFDYILKPLDEMRIKKTFRKLRDKIYADKIYTEKANEIFQKKLLIEVDGRKVFIDFDEIILIESCKQHKILVKTINYDYLATGSLQGVEQDLSQAFFRSHKGFLVNLKYLKEIIPSGRTFQMILKNGNKVLLSREREKVLKEKLNLDY